jgi:hypothetical protein
MPAPENESRLEKLRQYPINEDEILSTWTARATLWKDSHESGGGRIMACDDHRKYPTRVIDTESHEVRLYTFYFTKSHLM